MACILRAPRGDRRGIVTFTTPERDSVIAADAELREAIEGLKPTWLTGLHHNWHDHAFVYDPLFDFSMAGDGDLIEATGRPFPRIGLDACNFVPECFHSGGGEPFWDILHLGRPVSFKGALEFLEAVRTLYHEGSMLRVLWICGMPGPDRAEDQPVIYDLAPRYESMFSADEQGLFTLLTPTHRYPFPLDLPTLAHLYRSAKVFVHFSQGERRCRIAAYAWASGLPVVAFESVGSLLPPDLRRPPAFFELRDYEEFPEVATAAVQAVDSGAAASESAQLYFDRTAAIERFAQELNQAFPGLELEPGADAMALEGLDIRLGRHHEPVGSGTANAVPMDLAEFVDVLTGDDASVQAAMTQPDPERWLAHQHGGAPEAGGSDMRTSMNRRLKRIRRQTRSKARVAKRSAGELKGRVVRDPRRPKGT